MNAYRDRRMLYGLQVVGLGLVLAGGISCGTSAASTRDCEGAKNARLHFVNITDTPGLTVQVSYEVTEGTDSRMVTCGPIDLPVSDELGLELAQFVMEADPGDVIQVQATTPAAVAAGASCVVRADATQSSGGRWQLFVDVFGAAPLSVSCSDGLETSP